MARRAAARARKRDDRWPRRWRRRDSAVPAEAWTRVPEAPARTGDPATGRSSIAAPAIDRASRDSGYRRAIATPCDRRRRWTSTRRTWTRTWWTAMWGPRRTMNHLDQPQAADPRRQLIPWVGNPAFNYGSRSLFSLRPGTFTVRDCSHRRLRRRFPRN